MRNKKLIFVATLILTISVLLCAFAGCQKEAKPAEILLSFYNSDAKLSVKSQELTNLKDYTSISTYGDLIVARKYDEYDDEYTYALFDIEKNRVVATSENIFSRIINGVFSTYELVDDERIYTFYDKNGVIKSSVKQDDYTTSSLKITFADGTIVIATNKGVVTFENTLDNAMNIANFYSNGFYSAEVYEFGNLIVFENSNNYIVYDIYGNYKFTVKMSSLLNTADDEEINVVYIGNGNFAIQVITELTDVEAQSGFDFIDDGEIFNENAFCELTTYIYNFESRELEEVDYDKVIGGVATLSEDEGYALLYTMGISSSKRLISDVSLVVTDNDLNEKLQLNDLVNNAVQFAVVDESTYIIADEMMINVFDKNGNLVKRYGYNNAYVSMSQAGFIKVGNYFYDIKGNEVLKLNADATWINVASDGLIYYVMENSDETVDLRIYDSQTKKTTTYDYEKFGTIVGGSSTFFTISDEDDNIQIYSYYTGKAISSKKFAYASVRMSGNYYIITATDEDGEITYFSYVIQ